MLFALHSCLHVCWTIVERVPVLWIIKFAVEKLRITCKSQHNIAEWNKAFNKCNTQYNILSNISISFWIWHVYVVWLSCAFISDPAFV